MEKWLGIMMLFVVATWITRRRGGVCMPSWLGGRSSAWCSLSSAEHGAIADQARAEGVMVLAFTDLEGFTEYAERHGDQAAHALLRRQQVLVEGCLARFGGVLVKNTGDGFLFSFTSAKRALRCAAEIQQHLLETDFPLGVRIGLHAGEVIQEPDKNLVGHAVNLAQRVMTQARGGQVLVSEVVRHLADQLDGFQFVDQGRRRLKGISRPQQLYAFQPVAALASPLDSVVERRLEALEQRVQIERG